MTDPRSPPPGSRPSPIYDLFDVVELPVRECPVHFAIGLPGQAVRRLPGFPRAALPEAGRAASGRGLSTNECRTSCLGEAAELASCCAWGSEPLVRATADELGPQAIPPGALNGFTPGQLRSREAWNVRHGGFDWRPAARDRRRPLEWLAVEDAYGGGPAFAPADFVFIGRRQAGDEDAVAIGDSNGCAAGPDGDAARLAALLELAERDATGRWWYGRRRRPPIDPAGLEGAGVLTSWLAQRTRRTWLFDITADLDIPVLAAVSAEPDGRDVALGFAARLDAQAAAISALTEMLQMEVSLQTARALGDKAELWAYWRRRVTLTTPPLDAALTASPAQLRSLRVPPSGSPLSVALDACARAGADLWFADMTRPAIGVAVFRALSTTLCHYKPRFARRRLLAEDPRDANQSARRPSGQAPLVI